MLLSGSRHSYCPLQDNKEGSACINEPLLAIACHATFGWVAPLVLMTLCCHVLLSANEVLAFLKSIWIIILSGRNKMFLTTLLISTNNRFALWANVSGRIRALAILTKEFHVYPIIFMFASRNIRII